MVHQAGGCKAFVLSKTISHFIPSDTAKRSSPAAIWLNHIGRKAEAMTQSDRRAWSDRARSHCSTCPKTAVTVPSLNSMSRAPVPEREPRRLWPPPCPVAQLRCKIWPNQAGRGRARGASSTVTHPPTMGISACNTEMMTKAIRALPRGCTGTATVESRYRISGLSVH